MEEEVICLDTSVLIEYFRKVKKSKSFLFELSENYRSFAVSVITEYEVYHGSNFEQDFFWDQFFSKIKTVTFNSEVNRIVIKIERELKQRNIKIDIPDLIIAGTALLGNMKLATLNEKHFEKIEGISIIKRK
jgi:predicted nucleic acid-binding protein